MKRQGYMVFALLLGVVLLASLGPAGPRAAMAQGPLSTPSPDSPDDGGSPPSVRTLLATSAGEGLLVPFQYGTTGVQTSQPYEGLVAVTVTGVGQASGTQWSDAFYIYTDEFGDPITPWHPTEFYNWTLWINGGPADQLIKRLPGYKDDHVYDFIIDAPGGNLNFAVGDTFTSDNTGAYTVEIIREAPTPWWKGVIGALTGVAKRLGLPTGELIARIKGLGGAWEGLLAGWQIYKVSELADHFGDADYRACLIDEAYNNYDGQNVRFRDRVDDGVAVGCALVGCTAESWSELSFDEKRNEDVWHSVCASVGRGYCSGYLLPSFMDRWLK